MKPGKDKTAAVIAAIANGPPLTREDLGKALREAYKTLGGCAHCPPQAMRCLAVALTVSDLEPSDEVIGTELDMATEYLEDFVDDALVALLSIPTVGRLLAERVLAVCVNRINRKDKEVPF